MEIYQGKRWTDLGLSQLEDLSVEDVPHIFPSVLPEQFPRMKCLTVPLKSCRKQGDAVKDEATRLLSSFLKKTPTVEAVEIPLRIRKFDISSILSKGCLRVLHLTDFEELEEDVSTEQSSNNERRDEL